MSPDDLRSFQSAVLNLCRERCEEAWLEALVGGAQDPVIEVLAFHDPAAEQFEVSIPHARDRGEVAGEFHGLHAGLARDLMGCPPSDKPLTILLRGTVGGLEESSLIYLPDPR